MHVCLQSWIIFGLHGLFSRVGFQSRLPDYALMLPTLCIPCEAESGSTGFLLAWYGVLGLGDNAPTDILVNACIYICMYLYVTRASSEIKMRSVGALSHRMTNHSDNLILHILILLRCSPCRFDDWYRWQWKDSHTMDDDYLSSDSRRLHPDIQR